MSVTDNDRYAVTIGWAYVYSLVWFVPVGGLAWWYQQWWGSLADDLRARPGWFLLFLLVSLVVGSGVHELIHGWTWVWLGGLSWSEVEIGVKWRALTPYAHCGSVMTARAYWWGTAMPGIVMGLVPVGLGLWWGNDWVMVFGLIFTLAAAGDVLILLKTWSLPARQLVRDHPSLAGCLVVEGGG
ncbi:MAG TPA: DUF3267 domain-containing protein [Anaerolineae bacterium]|nr:DUF3267 domain-containing protein [Anaerolineae bacterium]